MPLEPLQGFHQNMGMTRSLSWRLFYLQGEHGMEVGREAIEKVGVGTKGVTRMTERLECRKDSQKQI